VIVQIPYLMESGLSDRVVVHVLDARGVAMYGGRAMTTALVRNGPGVHRGETLKCRQWRFIQVPLST